MQYEDAIPQVFKTTCEVEQIMQLFFLLKYTWHISINISAAPSPKLD